MKEKKKRKGKIAKISFIPTMARMLIHEEKKETNSKLKKI